MNWFENELQESAKIPVQPPEDLDGISRILIVLGLILWGVMIYGIIIGIKNWFI